MDEQQKSIKETLRREYRQARMQQSAEERRRRSEEIARRVLQRPELAAARAVFCYLADWGEVETSGIVAALLQRNVQVFVPQPDVRAMPADGFCMMTLGEEGEILRAGPDTVDTRRLDVILVPAIVWDRSGHRIGFGGGYFDRLLAARRPDCVTIGLGYDFQVVDREIPADPWDQPVDILMTEESTYGPQDSN